MGCSSLQRFEGRLFADAGCLYLVVQTSEAAGTARVSCRQDGRPRVVEMPLAEVARRMSAGGNLLLDNADGAVAAKRLVRKPDGWFFSAREGHQGPFPSEAEAKRALGRYLVTVQSGGAAH
jgi:hypothetical protein